MISMVISREIYCPRKLGTWWFIPLSKWVTTLVINGIRGVSPLITGVITHTIRGMNQQVGTFKKSVPRMAIDHWFLNFPIDQKGS